MARLPVERPRQGRCPDPAGADWFGRTLVTALLLALLPLSLLLAACGGPATAAAPPSAPSPALGREVALNLPSHEGALVTLPLGKARATIIDAFSPTCEPCREKVPALLARRGDIEQAGGRLVLVAVLAAGESTADAALALRSWGAEAPFLIDRGDVLRRECAVDSLPATVVLDARGAVRWVAGPTSSAEDIVLTVRSLGAEP